MLACGIAIECWYKNQCLHKLKQRKLMSIEVAIFQGALLSIKGHPAKRRMAFYTFRYRHSLLS
jgi:hypothetical protein